MTVLGLGVLCVAALLARRALAGRAVAAGGMRVMGRLAIEPRRSLVLVEAGGRQFLVGVGDGPMTLLAELTRADAAGMVAVENKQSGLNVFENKQSGLNVSEPALLRAWRRVVGGRA
jgi:flagellar biosynthetic protein FliO